MMRGVDMQTGNQNNRRVVRKIIFSCILLLFIIIIFLIFTKENNERIVRQNASYVQDAAVQAAKQIDEVTIRAQNNINTMAHLCGKSLKSPEMDIRQLKSILSYSSFDYVEFVDKDGVNITADGEPLNIVDRECYIEGMKGNSGVVVVVHSRISDETVITFYSPVRYKGEIIGVLQGLYRAAGIKEILSSEFFGVQSKSYLCTSDGMVISSCGDENAPENILQNLPETMKVSEEVHNEIKRNFKERTAYGYQYESSQGPGIAYLTGISQTDWMLIQTFPSAVTDSMIDNANAAGVQLEIQLVVAFGIYMFSLLFLNWKQKKKLVFEKQEMCQIVNGVTQLFSRFVVVDLKADTYKYLKNMEKGLAAEGRYTDLVDYFAQRYVKEEDGLPMSQIITKEYIQEHIAGDLPYLQYEYRIHRESQSWENISILSLKEEDGVPCTVLLAIQDVTALKENELHNRIVLKEAFEAADEANRAKSDFLSRMSHDIRTPMNAIMGMTAVAVMNIDDRERLMDCLNKITLSSRHLLALINDVLDMSKIESGKVTLSEEEFDMPKTVESLLAIIHPQIQAKNQELKVNVSHITHEGVIGDSLRLQQVFVNIMGNAVKFTPEGGTISFSISEKPSHIQGSGCYEFVFEDNGIGMEEEFIDKIFEPFARAENTSGQHVEGTGLGMPISKNIVRMMNGDIQVESKLGAGSKFTVRVYLKLQNVEKESVEYLKELRVLVADDDEDACENACEMLNAIGMLAEGVNSGDAAIEKLQNSRDYSVVILDWKMPGKCGVETTREIRKKLGDEVPIIILSAYDWSAIEQEAKEAGVNAFIAKPLFQSRLLYVLKSVIGNQEETEVSDVDELQQSDYSGKKVLVVEDNDINIEIAEELLTYIGIEVEKARNGQQAVDIVRNRPENYFDLVFMDIQMPVKNGYEAAREIRESGREDLRSLPIIAMSADAFSDDIQKCMTVGMNAHVAKPIELSKLLDALEKWMK